MKTTETLQYVEIKLYLQNQQLEDHMIDEEISSIQARLHLHTLQLMNGMNEGIYLPNDYDDKAEKLC